MQVFAKTSGHKKLLTGWDRSMHSAFLLGIKYSLYVFIILSSEPHRWRNGFRARREYGRSWVRAPVGSKQRL